MPTYTYACTACGDEFDAVQSISDSALTTCPACQGTLRKVFHPVGVAFKGSGFYRTDSRAGGASGGSDQPSGNAGDSADAAKDATKSTTGDSGSSKAGKTADKTSPPSGGSTTPAPSKSTGGSSSS